MRPQDLSELYRPYNIDSDTGVGAVYLGECNIPFNVILYISLFLLSWCELLTYLIFFPIVYAFAFHLILFFFYQMLTVLS